MATRKAAGTARNLTDSNPQYLGVKLYAGEIAKKGAIIVRQRGTKIMAGTNVMTGKDHTIFSIVDGIVTFSEKRKKNFDGSFSKKKIVSVVESSN